MNNKLIELMIVIACVSLFAAIILEKIRLNKEQSNKYNVTYLFETNNVKVYRFEDNGYYRYLTDSTGKIQWNETTGKTSHNMEIETK